MPIFKSVYFGLLGASAGIGVYIFVQILIVGERQSFYPEKQKE